MKTVSIIILAMLISSSAFAAQIEGKFIQDSAISAAKIATDAVTNSKIQDGAVTSSKLGSGAVNAASLGANAVGAASIRLENNTALRARNAAGSGDVNLFKLNASDLMEFSFFPLTPSSAPTTNYQTANKKYVDDAIAGVSAAKTNWQEQITLSGGDITAQLATASHDCDLASVVLFVSGVAGLKTADYTLSSVGGFTEIDFVASTGWGTGSGQALIAGDVIDLHCQY